MRAEDGADSPELRASVFRSPAEHIARLDQLIADQADELARLSTTMLEVTALCDLAEWASDSNPDGAPAVVLVEDLRRLLVRPAPEAVPPSS